MKTKRFFILPYSLHGEHIPHLMGRVVLDPLNPLRRFVPDTDDGASFHPDGVVPTIRRDPVPYQDLTEVVRAASGAKLRARLSDYLGLETRSSTSSSVELRAATVRRYEMVNHATVFRKFMAHDAFRSLIEGLLSESKNGEALMVVGFYTAEKGQWVVAQTRGREHAIDVQVPVGAIVGAPVSIDPGFGASVSSSAEHSMKGEVKIEEVFAVAYDVIKKKHSIDRAAKRWVSSTPVLGDEKRVQAGYLGMGQDASDDELEYESEGETDAVSSNYVLDADEHPSTLDSEKNVDYIEL